MERLTWFIKKSIINDLTALALEFLYSEVNSNLLNQSKEKLPQVQIHVTITSNHRKQLWKGCEYESLNGLL